jgi:purine-binding chemotaxis protein CheW
VSEPGRAEERGSAALGEALARIERLERALVALAGQPRAESAPAALVEGVATVVRFLVHGDEYGVPIASVQEVLRYVKLTRAPAAAGPVAGVLNLRGQPVPVLDARERLGLGSTRPGLNTPILVLLLAGGATGFIVDQVLGVDEVTIRRVEPQAERWLCGSIVGAVAEHRDRLVQLLDTERVLVRGEEIGLRALRDATACAAGDGPGEQRDRPVLPPSPP